MGGCCSTTKKPGVVEPHTSKAVIKEIKEIKDLKFSYSDLISEK